MVRSLLMTCVCLIASSACAQYPGQTRANDPANYAPTLSPSAFGPPAYSQPYAPSSFNQPSYNQPSYGQTSMPQQGYGQHAYGGQPNFAPADGRQFAPNAAPPQYSGGYGRRFRSSGFGSQTGYNHSPSAGPGGYSPPPGYGNQTMFAPQGSPGFAPGAGGGGSCGPGCNHNH